MLAHASVETTHSTRAGPSRTPARGPPTSFEVPMSVHDASRPVKCSAHTRLAVNDPTSRPAGAVERREVPPGHPRGEEQQRCGAERDAGDEPAGLLAAAPPRDDRQHRDEQRRIGLRSGGHGRRDAAEERPGAGHGQHARQRQGGRNQVVLHEQQMPESSAPERIDQKRDEVGKAVSRAHAAPEQRGFDGGVEEPDLQPQREAEGLNVVGPGVWREEPDQRVRRISKT